VISLGVHSLQQWRSQGLQVGWGQGYGGTKSCSGVQRKSPGEICRGQAKPSEASYTYTICSWQTHFSQQHTMWVKKSPLRTCGDLKKRLGIFQPNFICLIRVPIYARLPIFIQLPIILIFFPNTRRLVTFIYRRIRNILTYLLTLLKLCHIKRDHPVHIMCAKCPPLAETHTSIFWYFPKQLGIYSPNFTHLLNVHKYAKLQIFIQLSPTMTKLCHINGDHPACVSVDGGHFEHIMVVALNMA